MPIQKFPAHAVNEPIAIAAGLGATSNSSDAMKYGIGPSPIWNAII